MVPANRSWESKRAICESGIFALTGEVFRSSNMGFLGGSPGRAFNFSICGVSLPAIPRSVPSPEHCIQKETMSALHMVWRPIPNSISILSQGSRSTLSSQRAAFSTSKNDKPQKSPGNPSSGNPSYPAFSFEGLGANRTTKVAVIACLTVVGTIESIFWAKVLWPKSQNHLKKKASQKAPECSKSLGLTALLSVFWSIANVGQSQKWEVVSQSCTIEVSADEYTLLISVAQLRHKMNMVSQNVFQNAAAT
jgi:hypothetical protein